MGGKSEQIKGENKEKNNVVNYINQIKKFNQLYYQVLLEQNNQFDRAKNTKAWKIMCLLRRVNEQLIKGNYVEKKKFGQWVINKTLKRTVAKKDELNNYSPIQIPPITEYQLPNIEITESVKISSLSELDLNNFSKIPHKIDIFRFPVIEWDFRWQRPQQISVQFEKNGHRVFYFSIETHGVCNPNATYDDISNLTVVKELQENIYWVKLCTNQPLNAYRDKISGQDLTFMKWSIKSIKGKFNVGATYSIVDLPFWSNLVITLTNNKVIYDCMDDHEGFSTNSTEMLLQEESLIKSSDIIFASSQKLYEKLLPKNPNTLLVRNAGEFEHFSKISAEVPLEIKDITGPIIGYYGAISEWFDIKLIEQLAKRNKNWTFVLVGNTFGCDVTDAEKLDNIIFTGEVPYKSLPSYLQRFDVCLIPFLVNNLTLATNPVKVYEYLAAGKPVVSTRLPELEYISEMVYLADDVTGFERSIYAALKEEKETSVLYRKEFAASNTWSTRYKEIEEYIMESYPKISIIIVTYNNWSFTKQCLESLFKNNGYPNFEIIVIDNNSTDETRVQLAKINHPNIKIVLSAKNLGFAGGNKVGCNLATGEYIILLNNDTIVTQNWIETLIKPLMENKELGMVGPVSNSVGNDQMLDFFIGDPINGPSKEWLKDFKLFYEGNYRYTNLLGFYCVAIKREVYEKAGDLDTNYGIGMFEDDDYCEQVKSLGYKLAIVEDTFVFHHGSASFKKIKSDHYQKLWEKNKAYFETKWNTQWSMPKPPLNIFSGIQDPNEIAKVIKGEKRLSPILIVGDWNSKNNNFKEFVIRVARKKENLIIVYTDSYNGETYQGLRKVGENVYFTNNLEIISKVEFKKIVSFKYDLNLEKIKSEVKLIDMMVNESEEM
ncbi:glycosyltransferase [Bacillus sp. FJAT-29937]|uniref:glycosyltransferase n=1 Tax=Bacillus sp. FJAT-29937 TaxID=1720553 RepID=UPI0008366D89|nr:glycosyltransferase [Bacillus sp. FJAT-29937]